MGMYLLEEEEMLKKKKKIFGKATAASSVALCGLSKSDAGRGSNTEPGIAKPVATFQMLLSFAIYDPV